MSWLSPACRYLVNGGASLEGVISVAIQGGVVLAAAYIVTRNLWLAIGFRWAWDVTEGSIFSVANSGTNDEPIGLLNTTLHGSTAVTGGSFGPEAGVIAPVATAVGYSRVAMPQTKMSAKDLATSFTEKWPPERSDRYV
ncbi:MAG: hypothetical protein ACRDOI_39025 [Trebonia sp.]